MNMLKMRLGEILLSQKIAMFEQHQQISAPMAQQIGVSAAMERELRNRIYMELARTFILSGNPPVQFYANWDGIHMKAQVFLLTEYQMEQLLTACYQLGLNDRIRFSSEKVNLP